MSNKDTENTKNQAAQDLNDPHAEDFITDSPDMADRIEIPPEAYMKAVEMDMVSDVWTASGRDRLVYTKDFYVALYKKLEHGESAVQAFRELGFDMDKIDPNVAYQAAKRARKKAKENRLYTVDPASYDGSVPPEEMTELAHLTVEEQLAYYKAREIYMTELLLAQKKTYSELGEMFTSLKQKK